MPKVIIIGCLAALAIITSIFAIIVGGYLWWRHKRSQLQFIEPNEDHESNYESSR